jgi:hypothetical protein
VSAAPIARPRHFWGSVACYGVAAFVVGGASGGSVLLVENGRRWRRLYLVLLLDVRGGASVKGS